MPITTLRNEITDFINIYSYFNTIFLKDYLRNEGLSFKDISVNQYLYQFKKNKQIFDAGLRWYSKISNQFILQKEILERTVSSLEKQFPFLEFNCWSIGQLKNYFHHLYTKDVVFIYSDFDSLAPLNNYLTQKGYNVYNNPGKPLVKEYFNLKENTIVLRPSITEEPVENHYSSIEKILVDLLLEIQKLNLFDRSEYIRIFNNIICGARINIAKMLRYSKRREIRKVFIDDIIKSGYYINCS